MESQDPDDPARSLRRLLALLLVLALAAAGGAFALSQRGGGSSKHRLPALFPKTFTQAGLVSGTVTLVSSYDAAEGSRRTTATLTARGNVYLVVLCHAGKVHLAIGSLTNSGPCAGKPTAVLALNLTQDTTVTATVTTAQSVRWGLALYN